MGQSTENDDWATRQRERRELRYEKILKKTYHEEKLKRTPSQGHILGMVLDHPLEDFAIIHELLG